MSDLQTHLETLAAHATPATTLLAIDTHQLRRFPDVLADEVVELARPEQIALRLLERETRLALRNPDKDLYHAHHPGAAGTPSPWAILLAPRGAVTRLYLSRVTHRRFYRPRDPIDAPPAVPGSLLATWDHATHAFTHITSDEQKHRVLFASTAAHHLYVPLDAPATGTAIPFAAQES